MSAQEGARALNVARRVGKAVGLKAALGVAANLLERSDPALRLARHHLPPTPPVVLASVYRARNAHHVQRLREALPAGSRSALWALDHVAPELASTTVGCGPGSRFDLLNRCLGVERPDGRDWVLVCDDDVTFRRGGPADLVRIAAAARLDLVQPAHAWGSQRTWPYTSRRLLVVARAGGFVEIGPVFAVGPAGGGLVLPLPEGAGMGWGTEASWAAKRSEGLRLGIVDAVLIDHLVAPGTAYDEDRERAREHALVAEHGLTDLRDLQRDVDVWRPWQRPRPLDPAPFDGTTAAS